MNDSAGNSKFTNSSFSVVLDSGSPNTGSSGGSSGGGGGGGSISQSQANGEREARISFFDISEIILKRGTKKIVELNLVNNDISFLNNCKLEFSDVAGEWLSNSDKKGLSKGEKFLFSILVNVPTGVEPGEYSANIIVKCDEGKAEKSFSVVAYRNNFEPEIIDYEKNKNILKVYYNLEEFSGESHTIIMNFELRDFDDVPRFKGQKNIQLGIRENLKDSFEFELPKDSFGEFNLVVKLNDGVSEVETNKQIYLPSGSSGLTGLVVSSQDKRNLSIFGLLIVVIGIVTIVLTRFYRRKSRKISFKRNGHLFELEM